MESNKKEVQVHMLPTEDKTQLVTGTNGELIFKKLYTLGVTVKNQHLYFTSDEEIKEGDWCIHPYGIGRGKHKVFKAGKVSTKTMGFIPEKDDMNSVWNPDTVFKIIASTDPKLIGKWESVQREDGFNKRTFIKTMAQPTQAFIEAYCKQGGIDKVLVEYECPQCQEWGYVTDCRELCSHKFMQLKVDPIHNTITTHRIVEKAYTREEVERLCIKAVVTLGGSKKDMIDSNWLNENL